MISGTVGPGFQSKKKQHKKKHHTVKQLLTKKENTSYQIISQLQVLILFIYIYRKQKNISIYRLSMYIYSLVPQT